VWIQGRFWSAVVAGDHSDAGGRVGRASLRRGRLPDRAAPISEGRRCLSDRGVRQFPRRGRGCDPAYTPSDATRRVRPARRLVAYGDRYEASTNPAFQRPSQRGIGRRVAHSHFGRLAGGPCKMKSAPCVSVGCVWPYPAAPMRSGPSSLGRSGACPKAPVTPVISTHFYALAGLAVEPSLAGGRTRR